MRFVPTAAALVAIAWLGAASAAVACSCASYRSAAEQVAATPLIFKGRVLDETHPGVGTTSTRFRTFEVLKGRAGPTVRISHPVDNAGCGVRFRRGTTVLVFADRGSDGALRTSRCSSARFSEAEYRRAARASPAWPSPSASRETDQMVLTYRPEISQGGVVGSAGARLSGTLIERNGCLVIAGDGGSAGQPVFPEGSARWEKGTRRLIFNGTAYPIASRITVGGGGV